MSSFSGDGRRSSSFDSLHFDFASLSSSRNSSSRPLRDQKPAAPAASWTRPADPSVARPPWTHQPAPHANRPAWTHQPAPAAGLSSAPVSMVGDIFGKTWSTPPSSAPSPAAANLGIPRSTNNPNLFSDLLGSSLGSGKNARMNAPIKNSGPTAVSGVKSSFSTAGLAENLPRTAPASAASGSDAFGSFASFGSVASKGGAGQPMRPTGTAPMGQKADPFASLGGFGMKATNAAAADANAFGSSFGSFQSANSGKSNDSFKPSSQPKPPPASNVNTGGDGGSFGAFQGVSPGNFDDFGMNGSAFPAPSSQKPASNAGSGSFDMFFPSPTSAAPSTTTATGNADTMAEWDIGAQFAAHDDGGATTELEGLPPPPAGLTVAAAKVKGMDHYKGGQYADAIKWLSWAVVLIEKTGDDAAIAEVLSCRASSYKEVGEYKKAIADCSKILEKDGKNVSVLVQRALLYESSEKYRLGAEDLRFVLKIDPGNRVARSTIHRLSKLAD